jgi:iron complex outermembrane receptor protein
MRDGIPLTLPDGQTPVDFLDLESIGMIEVLRGTASALYGNASGGVVDMRSEAAPTAPLAGEVRFSTGGDFRSDVLDRASENPWLRWHGSAGGTSGPLSYQGSVTQSNMGGFRLHARQQTTHASARAQLVRGPTTWGIHASAFDMPVAENPGALTAAELASDPTAAEPAMVRRAARKDVSQLQLGLTASRIANGIDFFASAFGGTRDLDNPLPFAIVAVDRASYGATARAGAPFTLFGARQRLTLGVDVQRMDDDRRNFVNCNDRPQPIAVSCSPSGSERGALTRSQREVVTGGGVYLRDELELSPRIALSLGSRYDIVNFDVRDRFLAPDPDDSGERSMDAFSPMVGLVARIGLLTSAYANVTTSFETPTATEMGNKSNGTAGINDDLDPQRTRTYEVGMKGFLASLLAYDAAVFYTKGRDELIPFEVASEPGRRFFNNAGKTDRRGFELGLQANAGPLKLGTSYSYSDFQFADFVVDTGGVRRVYDGNRIPGIPKHQAQGSVAWMRGSLHAAVEAMGVGRVFVDDANTTSAPGYGIFNLRVGSRMNVAGVWVAPVIGIQNLFDRSYVGSVSVNANPAGGRFFEPGPSRTVYAAMTVELGR